MAALSYAQTADRPEAVLALPDGADVTTGYTFTLKIGIRGETALLSKSTNIVGGDGFVTVSWVAGELAVLDPGPYTLQLTATTGGLDRVYTCSFAIGEVVA